MEPRPRALGAQSLSHWTSREVLKLFFYSNNSKKKKKINEKECEMIHANNLTAASFGEGSGFGGRSDKGEEAFTLKFRNFWRKRK